VTKLPAYRPQLATLVDVAPAGDGFLHEIKLDGYRIGCSVNAGKVRLESRRGNDWTQNFPRVAEAAKRLRAKSALLDGEVAMLMPNGITSFQALQNTDASSGKLVYFVFDLLYLNGEDVASLPLEQRKQQLRTLLEASSASDVIKYTDHVVGDGARVFREACKLGSEGIVSKVRTSAYRPGRNAGWLKVKCVHRQEFVVGGFTDPEGSRAGFGALLVGYYDAHGALVYAGKVGTGKGFTREFLSGLRSKLDTLAQSLCPFALQPKKSIKVSSTHWVQPVLVAEVQFVEWTSDGHLRHPSLVGFRADKQASEVVREQATKAKPR
jgi:bifunctional non-homologous end joining protein LigD